MYSGVVEKVRVLPLQPSSLHSRSLRSDDIGVNGRLDMCDVVRLDSEGLYRVFKYTRTKWPDTYVPGRDYRCVEGISALFLGDLVIREGREEVISQHTQGSTPPIGVFYSYQARQQGGSKSPLSKYARPRRSMRTSVNVSSRVCS